ncbi:MAG: TetR family transcriptional regulator [Candidatus Dormiibacterota bacterium]
MTKKEQGEGVRAGLSRARLAAAALELIQEDGLEALSMRGLAERLDVKAASLYWHVRDRQELVELLAESIMDRVAAPRAAGWRAVVAANAAALRRTLRSQRDAGRVLLEVPGAMARSASYARVVRALADAGLPASEAAEVALMVMTQVAAGRPDSEERPLPSGAVASIAVDSGSRGVALRAGQDMESLIKVPHDPATAAPAVVRGDTVKVRRLRGVGRADIELSPRHPWRFQVQGPTWNTVIDASALEVREVRLDSGAAKVEIFLPHPRGVVPIEISGGVAGIKLHCPTGAPVAAEVKGGSVRLKLGELAVKAAVTDLRWESEEGAALAVDRYELLIHGGAVQVELDTFAPSTQAVRAASSEAARPGVTSMSALEILLDGVESRVRRLH